MGVQVNNKEYNGQGELVAQNLSGYIYVYSPNSRWVIINTMIYMNNKERNFGIKYSEKKVFTR